MSSEKLIILGVPEGIEPNPSVEQRIEYVQQLQELIDSGSHLEKASEFVREGCYPVFYSNHNQHVNIAGMRLVYSAMSTRPNDLYVAVAYSLLNSGQDKSLVKFARGLMPLIERDNVHFVPVARKKDVLNIKKDKGIEQARTVMAETRNNLEFIYSTLTSDAGLIFFPETTTEGAVKENGKRKGMIEVKNTMFEDLIERADKVGRKLVFVPVGMADTNKIAEPRKSKPHFRVLYEIGKQKVSYQLGIDLGETKPLAEVRVGEPVVWRGGYNMERKNINDFFMNKVAQILPEEARGFYR